MVVNLGSIRVATERRRYSVEPALFGRFSITDAYDGGRVVLSRLPDRCTAEVAESLLNDLNDDLEFRTAILANQGLVLDGGRPALTAGRG